MLQFSLLLKALIRSLFLTPNVFFTTFGNSLADNCICKTVIYTSTDQLNQWNSAQTVESVWPSTHQPSLLILHYLGIPCAIMFLSLFAYICSEGCRTWSYYLLSRLKIYWEICAAVKPTWRLKSNKSFCLQSRSVWLEHLCLVSSLPSQELRANFQTLPGQRNCFLGHVLSSFELPKQVVWGLGIFCLIPNAKVC